MSLIMLRVGWDGSNGPFWGVIYASHQDPGWTILGEQAYRSIRRDV